ASSVSPLSYNILALLTVSALVESGRWLLAILGLGVEHPATPTSAGMPIINGRKVLTMIEWLNEKGEQPPLSENVERTRDSRLPSQRYAEKRGGRLAPLILFGFFIAGCWCSASLANPFARLTCQLQSKIPFGL